MTKIIAHRGYSAKYPENTLLSFKKAVELGTDSIELDAQVTKDGHLVVHHMYYLGSSNNGDGLITEKTHQELKKLDAGSWFDKQYSTLKIPDLEEVFETFGKDTHYELELKGFTQSYLKSIVSLVDKHKLIGNIEFTSPNPYILTALRSLLPESTIGMFSIPIPDWMNTKLGQDINLNNALLGKFNVLHCPLSMIDKSLIKRAHDNHLAIHAADVNLSEDLKRAFELSVDQLSTNHLETALEIKIHGS